ncbi:hypothetical protein MXD81_26605, partial [Microbacteriaceae bacterium K1510]|nr:hypothetical protein [Microbacteriaceae bacterium K1510]
PFKSVIFDEIQELRNGFYTAKGASAKTLLTHAQIKMGLTATQIYNYGSEIYNFIEYLDTGALGTWIDFNTECCSLHGTHWK